jgi:AcrR family transcriptional regulator
MAETAKSVRRSAYHSPLRARQAAATRQAVLVAATRLFIERGWAGTTLASVAAEAGTAVETVYSGFGSKSGLLAAVIDVALIGDDEPVALAERSHYRRLGEGNREQRLDAAALIIALAHERSFGLLRTLQEAAASDSAAKTRWEKFETDRRTEIENGLGLILDGPAGDGLADTVWALTCPEVFGKLVYGRGWSVSRYQRWLVDTVGTVIVGDGDGSGPRDDR